MKIWHGYNSEHSTNLVMIGKFKTVEDASKAKEIMEVITEEVRKTMDKGINLEAFPGRFDEQFMALFKKIEIFTLAVNELAQFGYEFDLKREEDQLVLTTEEIDVSGFLKVLIHEGARVDVYSAHEYPDTGHGR